MTTTPAAPRLPQGARLALLTSAALMGLAGGWTWFAAPAWLAGKVKTGLIERAARRGFALELDRVWLAPTSHLTLDGIRLRTAEAGRDAAPLLEAQRVHIALEWQGLWSPKLWLQSVDVLAPVLRVVRKADGKLALADVLERLQRKTSGDGEGGGLRKYLSRHLPEVRIHGAVAEFADQTPGPHPKLAGLDLGAIRVEQGTLLVRNRSAVQEVARLEWQAGGRVAGLPWPLRLTGKLEWPKKTGEITVELPPQLALDAGAWRAQVASVRASTDGQVAVRGIKLARLGSATALGLDVAEVAATLSIEPGPEVTLPEALQDKLPAIARRALRHVREVAVHKPVIVTDRRPAPVGDDSPADDDDDEAGDKADAVGGKGGSGKDGKGARTASKAAKDSKDAKAAKDSGAEDGHVVREALAAALGRGADKLQLQLGKVRGALSALPVPVVTIHQGSARFADQGDGAARELSNLSARLERKPGEDVVTAQVDFAVPGRKAQNRVEGRLDTKTGDAEWKISLEHLPLQPYAAVLPGMLQASPQSALGEVAITLLYAAGPGNLTLDGKGRIEHISLFAKRISRKTLEDFTVAATGKMELQLGEQRMSLAGADVEVGKVHFLLDGLVERFRKAPKFQFQLRIPTVPCQDAADSVPRGFADMLEGLRCDGQMSYEIKGSLDTANMSSLRFDFGADLQTVEITHPGKYINLAVFQAPFEHHARQKDGSLHTFVTGPGSALWSPLSEISNNFTRVLFNTEDGGFWGHKGFSLDAIKEAMVANLKRGRFARGASTITQQLVKNLFFVEREKTISRKVQEAVVTWYIERKLPKQQILELYLNIIELGPKIYGIRDAASHYFARSPSQLTLLQSLWLASIIPNPRAFYHHFRKGAVSDEWKTYLTWIAGKMFERGSLSAEEYARLAATGFAVHFGAGPDGSEPVDTPALGHEVPGAEDGEPAAKPGAAPSVDPDQQP